MSLVLGVGDLALGLRDSPDDEEYLSATLALYRQLDAALRQAGLPGHVEPARLEVPPSRSPFASAQTRWLHLLRYAYWSKASGALVKPVPPRKQSAVLARLDREYRRPTICSHLVHFSDAEGFYVPVDFPEVLHPDDDSELQMDVGSSIRLLDELQWIAVEIGIDVKDGVLSAESLGRLSTESILTGPFAAERAVWFLLFESAVLSVKLGTAIRLG